MRMRKLLCILSLVLVLGTALLPGSAETLFIRDGAALLTEQTQSDAEQLSRMIAEQTDLNLLLDIRHFLGGAEAGAYARKLLNELTDPDNSMLLLVVVGEESYALAAGSKADKLLGKDIRDTLLSKHFRAPFLNRQYDQAVGGFMLSVAQELSKTTGERLDPQGLFGYAGAQSTQTSKENKGVNIFDYILGESVTPAKDASASAAKSQREERELSLGGIILIGLILWSIFGKKGRRQGCGCGPLGWILSVFGISKLFGRRP